MHVFPIIFLSKNNILAQNTTSQVYKFLLDTFVTYKTKDFALVVGSKRDNNIYVLSLTEV